MMRHSGEKPHACQLCGKGFRVPSHLKLHMQQHRNERFPCNLCDKVFSQERYLQRHVRLHNTSTVAFSGSSVNLLKEGCPTPCPTCKPSFTAAFDLQTHLDSNSMDTLSCHQVCNQSFDSQSALHIDLMSHEVIYFVFNVYLLILWNYILSLLIHSLCQFRCLFYMIIFL